MVEMGAKGTGKRGLNENTSAGTSSGCRRDKFVNGVFGDGAAGGSAPFIVSSPTFDF